MAISYKQYINLIVTNTIAWVSHVNTVFTHIEIRVFISFPVAEIQAFRWGKPLIEHFLYEFSTPGL